MIRLVMIPALSVLLVASACTLQTATTSEADAGADNTNTTVVEPNPSKTVTKPMVDAGTPRNALAFVPTNIPGIVADGTANIEITDNCTFNTDDGTTDCASQGFRYQTLTQSDPDKTEVAVFVTGSLTIGTNAVVSVEGNRPLVLVTSGEMLLRGTLLAMPNGIYPDRSNGGGFSGPQPNAADHKGNGPGGGGAPVDTTGGGGGAYCGNGGGTNGGKPYGNAEISPLLGGSSGGLGGDHAGGGGGAIQLISATSINLTSQAKINVGGGGGGWDGDGAGSGGAVILEAPSITMGGTIAANGGGGGANSIRSNTAGHSGTADSIPAVAGSDPSCPGGKGSAGVVLDGAAGLFGGAPGAGLPSIGGGGGGGAGRVRINTSSGQATISGTTSPDLTTVCFSQGKVKTSN